MTDVDAVLLYSRVGRVYFNGTGDALDFINTIESRTRTGYSDYQRMLVVEISVSAAAQQPDQLPPEPKIPAVDPATFATGMAGINQGLAALNQAMPLVQ